MNPQVLAYIPLVTPLATLVVVFVGILFSNRHVDVRISDLQAYINSRFADEARVNEANFKLLLSKIDDIDSRLTRLEERFAR
jgi:hypothetical protein